MVPPARKRARASREPSPPPSPTPPAPPAAGKPPPEPKRKPPAKPKPKRRRRVSTHWTVFALRGLMGALTGLVLVAVVAAAAGGYMIYQHFAEGLPDVDGLRAYQPPVMSRVYANDGRLLAELATERRIFVPIAAIPEVVRQSFVSAEDRNFYTHKGIDPLAIVRAAATNLLMRGHGKRPVGASTITQQVVKNMLLDNQATLSRKAREAILAFRMEKSLTKNQILELYLNEIYLGLGAYGVAAAAETYFNKPLDQLTVGEAAFLAALPKAPNNYNPFRYPDAARAQRERVLDRLSEDHVLTAEQVEQARKEPIVPVSFRRPQVVSDADWFAEDVRRQLISLFGQENATEGGLSVRTSLDPVLQAAANKALRDGLMKYDRAQDGWRGPVTRLESVSGLETDWPRLLMKVARTPGMLPTWHLAVVLSTADNEARLGWVTGLGERGATLEAKLGVLTMQDLQWARSARSGGTPKRIVDVVQVGDVVMVEPSDPDAPAAGAPGGVKPASTLPRVTLRQIPRVQGALVCIDPTTGRVLAMVGGFSFEQSQFNRATQAMRQPGSSFKPMVYLTALQAGLSPNQLISNSPLTIMVGNTAYEPENSSQKFGPPVPMRTALQFSMNVPAVRVAQKLGMGQIAKTAAAFHFHDALPKVISAALGSIETTPIREAGAYAGLAAGGKEVLPTVIDSVQDRNGRIVWRPHGLECTTCQDPSKPPEIMDMRPQVADPYSVRTLIDLMEAVVTGGTGRAAGEGFKRPIAGKTGTTQDYTDAWFSGFTPDLVTTIWIGKDNNQSLGHHEEGGVVSAPIWHAFMTEAFKGRPVLDFPQAAGPRMSFPGPEGIKGVEAVIGGGGGGGGGGEAVQGGVDNKLGGLY